MSREKSSKDKKNANSEDSFGTRLRQARKNKGLTQKQLGQELGKCKEEISRLEAREIPPGGQYLCTLAEALEVSLDWLGRGKESKEEVNLRYVIELAEILKTALDQFVKQNQVTPKKE